MENCRMFSFDCKWERKQISKSSMNQKHHCHPAALTIHGFSVQGTLSHSPLVICFSNCAKCSTRATETDSEKHANTAQIFPCFLLFLTTALPEQTQFDIPAQRSVIPQSSLLWNRANHEWLCIKKIVFIWWGKWDWSGLQTISPAYLISWRISELSPGSQHGTGNALHWVGKSFFSKDHPWAAAAAVQEEPPEKWRGAGDLAGTYFNLIWSIIIQLFVRYFSVSLQ